MNELLQGTNLVFLAVFGLVFVALAIKRVPLRDWGAHFIAVGILGTFTGILLALLGFDTNAIDESVPKLIGGMRTAFFTSVLGMGLSVVTKLGAMLMHKDTATAGEPTARDYLDVMRRQQKTLDEIKAAVGGDGDSSMLTQMGKIRLDMQDFMKKLEEQSTQAIIAALEQVVRDFNRNLTEQFGENFKQLNEAVGRMLTWMQQHADGVERSQAQLDKALAALSSATQSQSESAAALKEAATAATRIRMEATAMVEAVSRIAPELVAIRASVEQLSGDSASLSANVDRLGDALPMLTEATEELAEGLLALRETAKGTGQATDALKQMTQAVRDNAEAVATQHKQLIALIHTEVGTLSKNLTDAQAQLVRNLGTALEGEVGNLRGALSKAQAQAFEQIRADLATSGQRNKEAIDKQVQALDKALQDELERSLGTLVGKLASLSEKFAKDYAPLTTELARVLQLAQKIEDERRRLPRG